MPRVIRYFDKVTEGYIDEIILPPIPIEHLQKIFRVAPDNPMYDSYPIDKAQKRFFNKYFHFEFNFDHFDYFLEYDD